ncbi:MAG: hypothetical protein AAF721_10180 [Myxococcota bacterium]
MALRTQTAAWAICLLAACSPASVSTEAEGPMVLVDEETPTVELQVVGCTASDPNDWGAQMALHFEFSPLDPAAPGTVALSLIDGDVESITDVGGPEGEDASDAMFGGGPWDRSDGTWCSTMIVELRHLEGGAVEADTNGSLSIDYFSDEPKGLTLSIEER